MANLRANPPKEIGGETVKTWKDYKDGSVVDAATGDKSTMELSGSNVLRYELADGTSVIVRPSGTEPKIKFYIEVRENLTSKDEYEATVVRADKHIDRVLSDLEVK